MRPFRRLVVWRKAHAFTLDVYRVTRSFPRDEQFGLVAQLRRAAASISANLADGCGRESDRELGRFVAIASGSASGVEYHLLLARDLDYVAPAMFNTLENRVIELKRMLAALHRAIRSRARLTTDH